MKRKGGERSRGGDSKGEESTDEGEQGTVNGVSVEKERKRRKSEGKRGETGVTQEKEI